MQAVARYSDANESDPSDALAYGNRALAYTLLGRNDAAKRDIDLATKWGADRPMIQEEVALMRAVSLDRPRKAT